MKISFLLISIVGALIAGCSKESTLPNPLQPPSPTPGLTTIANNSTINLTIGTSNYFLANTTSFLVSGETFEISGNNQFYLYVPFNSPVTDTINCIGGALLLYINGEQFYECDTASAQLVIVNDTLRGSFSGTFFFNDNYSSLYKTSGTLAQIPPH